MALIRTTLRIEQNLKKEAERMALEQGLTLQYIFNEALRNAVTQQNEKKLKTKQKIKFISKNMGSMPDTLTRDFYYDDPKF
ncbi:MAG: hypothetical protein O2871_02760 [bacterium]|nr:hypothetical protein [bacterium]